MRQPRIFDLIQKAHSALFRASDRAMKDKLDLTASQQAILFVLHEKDGVPITAIAEALNMGKSSITGLIDRMTDRGLVQRRQNAADARSFNVFITSGGRAAVNATLPVVGLINADLLQPFSGEEQATIERFLRHVSQNAQSIVSKNANNIIHKREET